MELAIFFTAAVCAAYAALCALMFVRQRKLLYRPARADLTPPACLLPNARKEELTAEDGVRLSAWYIPPKTKNHKTILYAHGNAGTLQDRAEKFAVLTSEGYGLLALSYRGYGDCDGNPDEKGLINDYAAAWDFLRRKGTEPEDIIGYGESLGTGVTVEAAAERQLHPAFLALEAPFMSIADVARMLYPWLPVRLLLLDRFDTMTHLDNVRSPVLVMHGEDDTRIPLRHGRAVYEQARSRKAFRPMKDTGHINFDASALLRYLQSFEQESGNGAAHETLIQSRK